MRGRGRCNGATTTTTAATTATTATVSYWLISRNYLRRLGRRAVRCARRGTGLQPNLRRRSGRRFRRLPRRGGFNHADRDHELRGRVRAIARISRQGGGVCPIGPAFPLPRANSGHRGRHSYSRADGDFRHHPFVSCRPAATATATARNGDANYYNQSPAGMRRVCRWWSRGNYRYPGRRQHHYPGRCCI